MKPVALKMTLAVFVLMVAAACAAAVSSEIPPVDEPKPVAPPYAVLMQRSIFIRGRQNTTPSTGPSVPYVPTSRPAYDPEGMMVFNGWTQADSTLTAFIEDTGANRVILVKPGDAIARGKITSITKDKLIYESNGTQTEVSIGENLKGIRMTASSSSASVTNADGSSPTPNATDTVLQRLRERRQREMGTGGGGN